jgi:hypothetical protein
MIADFLFICVICGLLRLVGHTCAKTFPGYILEKPIP